MQQLADNLTENKHLLALKTLAKFENPYVVMKPTHHALNREN